MTILKHLVQNDTDGDDRPLFDTSNKIMKKVGVSKTSYAPPVFMHMLNDDNAVASTSAAFIISNAISASIGLTNDDGHQQENSVSNVPMLPQQQQQQQLVSNAVRQIFEQLNRQSGFNGKEFTNAGKIINFTWRLNNR